MKSFRVYVMVNFFWFLVQYQADDHHLDSDQTLFCKSALGTSTPTLSLAKPTTYKRIGFGLRVSKRPSHNYDHTKERVRFGASSGSSHGMLCPAPLETCGELHGYATLLAITRSWLGSWWK